MKTFILGATGATGRYVVQHLFDKGHEVKAVVRSADRLPAEIRDHESLTVIEASILDISQEELANHISDCDAVVSCLGHRPTFKGMWGEPRRLVTDAVSKLCSAIEANKPEKPFRFILMNTVAYRSEDLGDAVSGGDKVILSFLRLLLPPHVDNEEAAKYLRKQIGQDHSYIEWVAVRPDGLIDSDQVSEYDAFPKITRPITKAMSISRINVADFIANLITDDALFNTWKGKFPVIYTDT